MQFQRTTQCSAATLPNGDWRCGWETVRISGSEKSAVFSNALNGELSVLLSPSQNMLPINPEGEPVAGGLRLVVKPRLNSSPWVVSACIIVVAIVTNRIWNSEVIGHSVGILPEVAAGGGKGNGFRSVLLDEG
mgnify:CR=1 FL=1